MHDTRRAILDALTEGSINGPNLATDLGVSRTAIWKHINGLRKAGFEIESSPNGYSLITIPEFNGEAIEYELEHSYSVEFYETIESTNNRARELAAEGHSDIIVVADEQLGGRGRLNRNWVSPPGGIWMSIVMHPALPPTRVALLTLAAAVGVVKAARNIDVNAWIKWPNDILVQTPESGQTQSGADQKLAGILTEMEGEANRVTWVVMGIGINANIPASDLPSGATSLQAQVGPINRRVFLTNLIEEFDRFRDSPDSVLDEWREYSNTLHRAVRVETPDGEVTGTAVDVTQFGELVIETETGQVTIHTGECEHLRKL